MTNIKNRIVSLQAATQAAGGPTRALIDEEARICDALGDQVVTIDGHRYRRVAALPFILERESVGGRWRSRGARPWDSALGA